MITSIKCSICLGFFPPPIPLPLSLIPGAISAKTTKSNGLTECSREVVGVTHSTKCSSQCKLPIRDWDRRSHPWAVWVSSASALQARITNVLCYQTKNKYLFCNHLWALSTFHSSRLSFYLISSNLSILFWMNCWCSAVRRMLDKRYHIKGYKALFFPQAPPSYLQSLLCTGCQSTWAPQHIIKAFRVAKAAPLHGS